MEIFAFSILFLVIICSEKAEPASCTRCNADVVFIIDSSSSITPNVLQNVVIPLMVNLTYGLQISSGSTHLSIIHFNKPSSTAVDAYLNTSYLPADLARIIQNIINLSSGDSGIFTALQLATTAVFNATNGARISEYGVTVAAYAILITDGIATDTNLGNPADIAYAMLMANISLYAIGVGPLAKREYLKQITYDDNRVYMATDFFGSSNELVDKILNDTCCPMHFALPTTSPYPVTSAPFATSTPVPVMPTSTPSTKYCEQLDLIFVLDGSETVNQINPNNFNMLKNYLLDLTEMFTIGPNNTRVDIVLYGGDGVSGSTFMDNEIALRSVIQSTFPAGGPRWVAMALGFAHDDFVRYPRAYDVPRYVVHFVEYIQDIPNFPYDPVSRALELSALNATMFAVTVTNFQYDTFFDTETKNIVAAVGHGSMQFNASSYEDLFNSELRKVFEMIIANQSACMANVTESATTPTTVGPNNYCTSSQKTNGGIKSSVTNAFASAIQAPTDCENLTALLILILEMPISDASSENVSEILYGTLFALNCSMTEFDVYTVALILFRISLVCPLSDETFNLTVSIVDIILNQDQRVIRRSNFLYNTTDYIQKFFYQLAAHTTLHDFLAKDTHTLVATVKHIDCELYSNQTTFTVVQYNDGAVCFDDKEVSPTISQDVETYMEFPLDALCQANPNLTNSKVASKTAITYRMGTVLYRNQKLFGLEDPASNANETKSPCASESNPQTNYVATMNVVSPQYSTSNAIRDIKQECGEVPNLRFNLSKPLLFGMNIKNNSNGLLHAQDRCAHWSNGNSDWFSDGCRSIGPLGSIKRCQCNHLTDFTIVVDYVAADPILCDSALSTFSLVLIIISIIALFIALLMHLLRNYSNKLPKQWQQLVFFMALKDSIGSKKNDKRNTTAWLMATMLVFLFLFVLLSDSRICNLSAESCKVAAAVQYTFLLCSFCWSGFCGLTIFKNYYVVWYTEVLTFITKETVAQVICSVIPIIITVLLWCLDEEFFSREDHFCWIRPDKSHIFAGVVLPITVFIAADILLTLLLISSLFCQQKATCMQSTNEKRSILISKCLVLLGVQFMLGLPWVLQYFTIGFKTSTPVHYTFAFFNATQGFWLALLYIVGWIRAVANASKKRKTLPRNNTANEARTIICDGEFRQFSSPSATSDEVGESTVAQPAIADRQLRKAKPKTSTESPVVSRGESNQKPWWEKLQDGRWRLRSMKQM